MAGKNTAAFGIYSTRAAVENAVDTLKAEGYRNTDISVLFPQNAGTKDFAHEKNTKAPEGRRHWGGDRSSTRRHLGLASGHWRIGHTRTWPFYRCGSNHGCTSRCRCGRSRG